MLDFIRENYLKIIIIIALASISYLIFYLSTSSLKKLKTGIFSSYPFDLFFPNEGAWSIGYFLIAIIVLGLLMFFLMKGGFYLKPA
jgi:hypothetical protein